MREARLLSISIGLPKVIERPAADSPSGGARRPWRTAIEKKQIQGPVWVGREGLAGDGQVNRKFHGGPERALLIYSAEHYPIWRAELGRDDLKWGGFGENLTVSALTEDTVRIGQRLAVGEVILQVASARQPCATLARWLGVKDMVAQVRRTARCGFYCRVLREGFIEPGLELRLLPDDPETLGPSVAQALR